VTSKALPASLPDSQTGLLLRLLPAALRPFALLARLDRPIGWWLLYWPCAAGVALSGGALSHWPLLGWLLIGAIAMRGAGCVYNDIVDADLDRQVARTAHRPLAARTVTLRAAWVWLALLCGLGLLVLFQLPRLAQLVALASLLPVAAYPFMKRLTWWPQLWLGLVFSWGALVGWAAVADALPPAVWALYAGCIAWTVGYDTIYALQDVEDDAIVGIRSSARAMGGHVRTGVAACYVAALLCWSAALWLVRPDPLALAALAPLAVHLVLQVVTLVPADARSALARFRANRGAGLLLVLACLTVGLTA
jgi:4-hydroxybenzoate polyprenyltransferase